MRYLRNLTESSRIYLFRLINIASMTDVKFYDEIFIPCKITRMKADQFLKYFL